MQTIKNANDQSEIEYHGRMISQSTFSTTSTDNQLKSNLLRYTLVKRLIDYRTLNGLNLMRRISEVLENFQT